jgi:hypothetical protein
MEVSPKLASSLIEDFHLDRRARKRRAASITRKGLKIVDEN